MRSLSTSFILLFTIKITLLFVHVYACVDVCTSVQVPKEARRGHQFTGSCEPPTRVLRTEQMGCGKSRLFHQYWVLSPAPLFQPNYLLINGEHLCFFLIVPCLAFVFVFNPFWVNFCLRYELGIQSHSSARDSGFSTPFVLQSLLSSLSFLLGTCETTQWIEVLAACHDDQS